MASDLNNESSKHDLNKECLIQDQIENLSELQFRQVSSSEISLSERVSVRDTCKLHGTVSSSIIS